MLSIVSILVIFLFLCLIYMAAVSLFSNDSYISNSLAFGAISSAIGSIGDIIK